MSFITGEGGSGGALALAGGDRVYILDHAVYSVVSPEGCASILWKSTDRAADAADALGLTADRLIELGIVEGSIDDDCSPEELASRIVRLSMASFDELASLGSEELLAARYARFRAF